MSTPDGVPDDLQDVVQRGRVLLRQVPLRDRARGRAVGAFSLQKADDALGGRWARRLHDFAVPDGLPMTSRSAST
jgi:hypothetical protein